LAAGAPAVLAEIVTLEVATVALSAALTVSVIVTGLAVVGLTALDGEKLQVTPVGKPLQLSVTTCPNEPKAVT